MWIEVLVIRVKITKHPQGILKTCNSTTGTNFPSSQTTVNLLNRITQMFPSHHLSRIFWRILIFRFFLNNVLKRNRHIRKGIQGHQADWESKHSNIICRLEMLLKADTEWAKISKAMKVDRLSIAVKGEGMYRCSARK